MGMRIVLLAVGLSVGAAAPALAASAVAIDPRSNQYSWHVSPTVEEAKQRALAACEIRSAGKCLVFDACGLPGPGAIAFNTTTGEWGAACGGPDQASVDAQAQENCELLSNGAGTCGVVDRFTDAEPGEAIEQGYFAGRWAEDCEAKQWYSFETVNPRTFRMQDCADGTCKDRDEVFRSLVGESVFIWPTDQTRLIKRGPDTLEMTRVNSTFLERCGG